MHNYKLFNSYAAFTLSLYPALTYNIVNFNEIHLTDFQPNVSG